MFKFIFKFISSFCYCSPITELIHNKLIVDQDPIEIGLFAVSLAKL